MFTDEKWFDSNDGRAFDWLKPKHGKRPAAVLRRQVEQGPPRIMVWGAVGKGYRVLARIPASADGKEKAIKINHEVYLDICKPHFRDMQKKARILQQDNCASHVHGNVTMYLKKLRLNTLNGWPAVSPDLSPIETVWALVAKQVDHRGPYGEDELWEFVQQEFMKIPEGVITDLMDQWERRLRLCRRNKGDVVDSAALAAAA